MGGSRRARSAMIVDALSGSRRIDLRGGDVVHGVGGADAEAARTERAVEGQLVVFGLGVGDAVGGEDRPPLQAILRAFDALNRRVIVGDVERYERAAARRTACSGRQSTARVLSISNATLSNSPDSAVPAAFDGESEATPSRSMCRSAPSSCPRRELIPSDRGEAPSRSSRPRGDSGPRTPGRRRSRPLPSR